MSVRQYIGARYVTKIYENSNDPSSAAWEAGVNYEPLVMVTYNNGSYLSKQTVPASIGDPANNPTYWVQTGFYNGQIASLQAQIDSINAIIGNGITENFELNLSFLGRVVRTDQYESAQGMVYLNGHIYTMFIEYATEDSIIVDMMPDGTIVGTGSLGVTHHANGLTTDGEYLYIAGGYYIYKVNPATYSIEATYTTGNSYGNLCYENGLFYSYLNGSIWVLNPDFTVNNEIVCDTLIGSLTTNFIQDSEIKNGIFYLITNEPNRAIAIDIANGSYKPFLYFNPFMDCYYPIGELQSISFIDDKHFIVNGKARIYNPFESTYEDVGAGQCGYGIGALDNSISLTRPFIHGGYEEFNGLAHVDGSSAAFRPTGRSGAYFQYLFELSLCMTSPYYKPAEVQLHSDFPSEDLIIVNNAFYMYQPTTINIHRLLAYNSNLSIRGLNADLIHLRNCVANMNVVTSTTNQASDFIFDGCEIRGAALFIKNGIYTLNFGSYISNNANSARVLLGSAAGPVASGTASNIALNGAFTDYKTIEFMVISGNGRIANSIRVDTSKYNSTNNVYAEATYDMAGTKIDFLYQKVSGTSIDVYSSSNSSGSTIEIYGIDKVW